MTDTANDVLATNLAVTVLAARVGAAAGRPSAAEAHDAAAYYRVVLDAIRGGLGMPPVPPPAEDG